MKRGYLSPIFAYAAGIGDIIAAISAGVILFLTRNKEIIPTSQIYFLLVIGILDLISAYFFGFFSSDTSVQLFEHDALYDPLTYPSGIIPLFLVPYAIFYHALSFLTLRMHGNVSVSLGSSGNSPTYAKQSGEDDDKGSNEFVE